jgi:hypothetical protein
VQGAEEAALPGDLERVVGAILLTGASGASHGRQVPRCALQFLPDLFHRNQGSKPNPEAPEEEGQEGQDPHTF